MTNPTAYSEANQALFELYQNKAGVLLGEDGSLQLNFDNSPDDYEPTQDLYNYLVAHKNEIVAALQNQQKADEVLALVGKQIKSLVNLPVFIEGATVTNIQDVKGLFFAEKNGAVFSCTIGQEYHNVIEVGHVLDIIGTWGRPWSSTNITLICTNYVVIRDFGEVAF